MTKPFAKQSRLIFEGICLRWLAGGEKKLSKTCLKPLPLKKKSSLKKRNLKRNGPPPRFSFINRFLFQTIPLPDFGFLLSFVIRASEFGFHANPRPDPTPPAFHGATEH